MAKIDHEPYLFLARYDGECSDCSAEIVASQDEIGWVDGKVCCENCVMEAHEDGRA
jgi:hypothetical protein